MWSPAWRARVTTSNYGATTARAGARSSSKAVSSTRSPRMPVRPGREARGRRCSARPGMPYENLRARMLRRAIGVLRQNLIPFSGRRPMLSRQAEERLGDSRQRGGQQCGCVGPALKDAVPLGLGPASSLTGERA